MEHVFERVCGLDVHKATIAACVRVPDAKGKRVHLAPAEIYAALLDAGQYL